MLDDRPAVAEGRSAIDARGITEAIELFLFQEERFGEAVDDLALRLQELDYWPDGVMLELSISGFSILERSSEKFTDSRREPGHDSEAGTPAE